MGIRELKAKYGHNKDRKTCIQRAIREEMVGGDDLLDSLETTLRLAQRLEDRDLAGKQLARDAHEILKALRDVMANVISCRYELED